MFGADTMPRSYNPALEQRECGLHRVCAYHYALLSAHILVLAVVDALMLRVPKLRHLEVIELGFIGHDYVNGRVHIAGDDLVQRVLIDVVSPDEVKMPAALTDSNDGGFVLQLPMVTALLPSDVCFVNLDCAGELVIRLSHCSPNPMAQIPRGLVADSESPLDLIRRHALARLTEQVRGKKPLPQGQMCVVEDRSHGDGELICA